MSSKFTNTHISVTSLDQIVSVIFIKKYMSWEYYNSLLMQENYTLRLDIVRNFVKCDNLSFLIFELKMVQYPITSSPILLGWHTKRLIALHAARNPKLQ